jgi:hypothetical protein
VSAFKVGDVVVATGLKEQPHCNGMEGTIIDIRSNWPVVGAVSMRREILDIAYRIEWTDGRLTAQEHHQIRLKRPPTHDDAEPRADFTPGEWDLCPWKPNTVRA